VKDIGGHFYPNQLDKDKGWSDGITRRDWLAGLAMQGMLSNMEEKSAEEMQKDFDIIPMLAYRQADAMIAKGLAK